MIKSVELHNFQSHRSTTVEFCEGINVLAGSSSHGKTAILRALGWALENKPDGKQFVSYWNRKKSGDPSEETSAIVTFDDCVIKRFKHGTDNKYAVDGVELITVGRNVPQEVTDAHRMDALNVHKQLDGPFLLSMSSGEVAKYLNSLVHLDVIDTTISNANSEIRGLSASIKQTEEQIDEVEKKVKNLAWVDRAVVLAERLEELTRKEEELERNVEICVKQLDAYRTYQDTIKKISVVVNDASRRIAFIEKHEISIGKSESQIYETKEQIANYEKWMKLTADYKQLVSRATHHLDRARDIDVRIEHMTQMLQGGVDSISTYYKLKQILDSERLINRAKELLERESDITTNGVSLKRNVEQALEKVALYKKLMVNITHTEQELMDELAKMPEVCPTCGQSIGECRE